MPELPEVETVVRDLDRLVRGGVFGETEVLRPDMLVGVEPGRMEPLLHGRRIERVTRRAKNIVFELDPDRLVVNLGMTGRLLVGQPGDADPRTWGFASGLPTAGRSASRTCAASATCVTSMSRPGRSESESGAWSRFRPASRPSGCTSRLADREPRSRHG